MQLFRIQDAEEMSKNAKQHILFDMADKNLWYNESIKDNYIPTYQDLQERFNGKDDGNLTLKNMESALKDYAGNVW